VALNSGGPVEEGSVGGGTGMNCYGFKGGNGTASRTLLLGGTTYTVAAFVQANFGDRQELTIAGVPMGDLPVPVPSTIPTGFATTHAPFPVPAPSSRSSARTPP
jgi:L-aminopeptidase/D-esterase-like protein